MTYNSRSLFPQSAFVGFDRIFDELDTIASRATDTYPPHSIVKIDENKYVVEIAVAGFKDEEIEVVVEDKSLIIRGKREEDGREYLHKGISTKRFERKFRLEDNIVVNDASLSNGILSVELERVVPESKKPRKIEIKTVGEKQLLID